MARHAKVGFILLLGVPRSCKMHISKQRQPSAQRKAAVCSLTAGRIAPGVEAVVSFTSGVSCRESLLLCPPALHFHLLCLVFQRSGLGELKQQRSALAEAGGAHRYPAQQPGWASGDLVSKYQCVNRDVFYKYALLQAALMRALASSKGTLMLYIILLFQ